VHFLIVHFVTVYFATLNFATVHLSQTQIQVKHKDEFGSVANVKPLNDED